jgi:LmbE family N-acetylglucosaminyl deacetylase
MKPIICNSPLPIDSLTIPKESCILVLAPHPDDFDAIGVTMRFFQVNGNPLYVTVATSGARGVEDSFCSPPTLKAKSKIREQEQVASCQFFGRPYRTTVRKQDKCPSGETAFVEKTAGSCVVAALARYEPDPSTDLFNVSRGGPGSSISAGSFFEPGSEDDSDAV